MRSSLLLIAASASAALVSALILRTIAEEGGLSCCEATHSSHSKNVLDLKSNSHPGEEVHEAARIRRLARRCIGYSTPARHRPVFRKNLSSCFSDGKCTD